MKEPYKHNRQQLVEKLKFHESEIITHIATDFFLQQPVSGKYDEMEKIHCENDLRYHLTFLRNAIEFGTPETFEHYVQWSTNLLKARSISHDGIQKFVDHVRDVLDSHLSDPEKIILQTFLLENSPEVQLSQHQAPPRSETSLKLECMSPAQFGHRGSEPKVVFGSLGSCYAVFRS